MGRIMAHTERVKVLGPLAVLGLLVAACGADPQVLDRAGTGHVLVGGDMNGGSDMLISGEVLMVGDCLGIRSELEEYVVVWPAGTELVEADDLAIDVPGIGRVEPGQRVSFGGGIEKAPFLEAIPDVPDGCDQDMVALANTDQSL